MNLSKQLFAINNEESFNRLALEVFNIQADIVPVYAEYIRTLGVSRGDIRNYREIPFLPINFFRTHRVYGGDHSPERIFLSSGTTATERSRHEIADLALYRESLLKGFRIFFGDPAGFLILGLMPSPAENPDSSLIFMTDALMKVGKDPGNGFFINDFEGLEKVLLRNKNSGKKVILIGLSYALLDFVSANPVDFRELIVIETGGMKGRRKEMVREDLHSAIMAGFGVGKVGSEYGMTELLSQAWSKGDGIFVPPPWMKVLIRDPHDPFQILVTGEKGGISVIDLANIHSCSFIATQDIGQVNDDGSFEVMGRFDNSELRGCNLMVV